MKPIYEYLNRNTKIRGSSLSKNARFWIESLGNVRIRGDFNIKYVKDRSSRSNSQIHQPWISQSDITLHNGECIYIYWDKRDELIIDGDINIGGDIRGANFENVEAGSDSSYDHLFEGYSIIDASQLDLSFVKLHRNCFYKLFTNNTSLKKAPELPATQLVYYCYMNMFSGCTSLTQAPELPATQLAEGCYVNMFEGCTSLTQAPDLPATKLEEYCYRNMFNECTSLTQAPDLPATQLANGCYINMFYGCKSLKRAPDLPATQLANGCYINMFNGCKSLTKAPVILATQLDDDCCSDMFKYTKIKQK